MLLVLSSIRFVYNQFRRWVAFGLLWVAEWLIRTSLQLFRKGVIGRVDFRYVLSVARILERGGVGVGFGFRRRAIRRTPIRTTRR
jgi:hypothetical protein